MDTPTAVNNVNSRIELDRVYDEIRATYLNYPHPWVLGYSGGKDSTTTLQLIWYALAELPIEQRRKPVYVISSDTLVETPVIVDYVNKTLDMINRAAVAQQMPFVAQKLMPQLDDTFWVNLIGRGYPAPNSAFRWCTDRLKIKPSNKFITEKVAAYGEVILILGIRRGESMTRDQVIAMHRVKGHRLARHGQLPGAWVFMPIEHFTVDDVWTYLLQKPSPWGGDNRSLSSLYRSAQSGECPLVVDTSTPSCGNSRFGCWTCTVVTRDKSMEAMIDSGEEWLVPLLNFRDWLAQSLDPELKPATREFKGRDGRIKITNGKLRYRTYTLEFSKEVLRRLLQAQTEVWRENPEFDLISTDELREIRRLWITDRQDWADELPSIYTRLTGREIEFDADFEPVPGGLEQELLNQLASEHNVPVRLVQRLMEVERQHAHQRRRPNVYASLERVLSEDWRNLDEILAAEQAVAEAEEVRA